MLANYGDDDDGDDPISHTAADRNPTQTGVSNKGSVLAYDWRSTKTKFPSGWNSNDVSLSSSLRSVIFSVASFLGGCLYVMAPLTIKITPICG